jgi:two-component system chemotaxis response regulator CheV
MVSSSAYDLFEDEEELDIVKLVSTDANDSNQYLLFIGSDGQYYAKNVSKIEELVVYKDLDIVYNNDNSLVIGTADVRGEMLTLVNFDHWMGGEILEEKDYELVIIVAFGGYKFGLIVKEVDYITTIESEDMQDSSSGNSRATFTSRVMVQNQEVLCTIVDSDKMIVDVFGAKKDKIEMDLESLYKEEISDKIVLFADDSKLVRNLIVKVASKIGIRFKVYENGAELLEGIKEFTSKEIGLIVTDIEMPVMGGKDVIKNVRTLPEYDDINILVFTNMSNDIMREELIGVGAKEVVTKIDVDELVNSVKKYIR